MKYNSTAIIIAISVLGAAYILSVGYKFKYKSTDGISVVGMAQVDFTSDLIVWEGSYSRKSADLKTAYASLKDDEVLIRNYLNQKGIPDSAYVISAVNLQQEFKTNYESNGEIISNTYSNYS